MKEIPLTRGKVALVDDEDFAELSKYKWYASTEVRGRVCAVRCIWNPRRQTIYMHRIIVPGYPQVDHIDGNALDNRRSNLRGATAMENQRAYRCPKTNTSSRFRGVSWHRRDGVWRAYIKVGQKGYSLGTFRTEEDAAKEYDKAALRLFGEFTHLNFKEAV